MAVPRNRVSNACKNSRRSHHAKKAKNFSACPNCSTPRLPHRVCPSCGQYNDRAVISKEEVEE